ncbi:STAS-like domain-containing protein [Pasteurella multocida]|uniref:STAS-like domain-containing protein n=1 Tax=Pasteurella multocida TaxID=747 RepID=UPI00202487D3|nr:STAS-like domain-containing protein [Pasteurella multocida]URJ85780.1 STAS-like domain-containing protein [Pasteurella multocida]
MNKIVVVDDFSKTPYGRSPAKVLPHEAEHTGEVFRQNILSPRLRVALEQDANLIVELTGYNRYGRSFIDEAFGGLIREDNFSYQQLKSHLKIEHKDVPSIVTLAWLRIKKAAFDKGEISDEPEEDI